MLKIILLSLLFVGLLVGCGETEPDRLMVFVASDLHYLSDLLKDDGALFTTMIQNGDGRQLDYIVELTDAFLAEVIAKKPDVLILSGDLTFNGEKQSHQELAEKLKTVEESGVAVYVIPGNHDINNPYARGYQGGESYPVETVTPEEFREIYWEFGYENPLYAHGESLSYAVEVEGRLWLYLLDTNLYNVDSWSSGGMMGSSLRVWLEETLALGNATGSIPIGVTHHNLLEHSSHLSFGYTIYDSGEALALYHKYGIKLNLSGHIHLQHIANAPGRSGTVTDISSGSLAINPAQYGVLTIDPEGLLEYQTAKVDVGSWAKTAGVTDENLLNYEDYTYHFFHDSAYQKFFERLESEEIHSLADREAIARLIALVNTHYFSGDLGAVKGEILASSDYLVWLSYGEDAPFKGYIDSMLATEEDSTRLTLQLVPPEKTA